MSREKTDYTKRLRLPLISPGGPFPLATRTGTLLCGGYLRVVIGGRGPYLEVDKGQLILDAVTLPIGEAWREDSDKAYYVELRSSDPAHVKIYYQKRVVDYADYKVGLCYVSPFDLYYAGARCVSDLNDQDVLPTGEVS